MNRIVKYFGREIKIAKLAQIMLSFLFGFWKQSFEIPIRLYWQTCIWTVRLILKYFSRHNLQARDCTFFYTHRRYPKILSTVCMEMKCWTVRFRNKLNPPKTKDYYLCEIVFHHVCWTNSTLVHSDRRYISPVSVTFKCIFMINSILVFNE